MIKKTPKKLIYFKSGNKFLHLFYLVEMTRKDKIQFIFVWRLTSEKGLDLILEVIEKIQVSENQNLIDKVHFHIFGDGPMKGTIPDYDFVSYYGFQTKEKMFEIWKQCHYTLMPSKFLETFGLSALDSLSLGIPVLVPDKWGLAQFVQSPKYKIPSSKLLVQGKQLLEMLKEIISSFDRENREQESKKARALYMQYTKEKRIERFQSLSWLPPGAKVLLVSDYIVDVGGVESFLFNVSTLLKEYWYGVELIWCNDKRLAQNRLVSLFGTFWNNKGAKLFRQQMNTFQADLVWRHSVQRWFGPLVLYEARHCRQQQRVMYHDFWLFHPYPSRVFEESQVYHACTFVWYIKESFRKTGQASKNSQIRYVLLVLLQFFLLPLVAIKWTSSFLIKRQLKKLVDLHLVPSKYMEKLVQKHYDEDIRWATLSHFV